VYGFLLKYEELAYRVANSSQFIIKAGSKLTWVAL